LRNIARDFRSSDSLSGKFFRLSFAAGGGRGKRRRAAFTAAIRAGKNMNFIQLRRNYDEMKKAMYTHHETVSLKEMIGDLITYLEAREKSARMPRLPQKTK
jgi:hypothetical protein